MKKYYWLLLVGILILINGCIPSIYPLYSDDTIAFEESLVGEWWEKDGGITDTFGQTTYPLWRFEKGKNGNYYNLIHTPTDEAPSIYEVHLVQLGNQYYFDFYPDGDQTSLDGLDDFLQIHLFPVHTFAKVEIEEDQVVFHMFDTDWLQNLIEQRKIRIRHEETNDMILLSAGTKELQQFVEKYGDDPSAYIDPIVLLRDSK